MSRFDLWDGLSKFYTIKWFTALKKEKKPLFTSETKHHIYLEAGDDRSY